MRNSWGQGLYNVSWMFWICSMPRYVDKWIFQNITKIIETHARNWQLSGLYTLFLIRIFSRWSYSECEWSIDYQNWFPGSDSILLLSPFCLAQSRKTYCSLVFQYVFLWLLLPVWSGQDSLISCFSKPRCLSHSTWVELEDLLSARPSSLEPVEVGNAHWFWSCHLQARELSETR